MLLLRRLDKDVEWALERLDILWARLTEPERAEIDAWSAALPQELRENGPAVQQGWDAWERASGLTECSICGLNYYDHPRDPTEPYPLHVSCDGRRWKL